MASLAQTAQGCFLAAPSVPPAPPPLHCLSRMATSKLVFAQNIEQYSTSTWCPCGVAPWGLILAAPRYTLGDKMKILVLISKH